MGIIEIIIALSILAITSYGYGTLFLKEPSALYKVALGFFFVMCCFQFIVPIIVVLKIYSLVASIFLIALICGGIFLALKSIKRLELNKNKLFIGFGLLVFLGIMIYSFMKQNTGNTAFDTIHYFSFVTNSNGASNFGQLDFATGNEMPNFYMSYDFQSFYYLFGLLSGIVQTAFSVIKAVPTVNIHIYIWVSSIIFFFLSYTLVIKSITIIGIKNKVVAAIIILLTLGFFGNLYFNKAFAFYGNTFRGLSVGYIMLEIYQMFKTDEINKSRFFRISMIMNCTIAVSSSGFFIVALIAYGLCATLILKKVNKVGLYIFLISLPISVFGVIYASANAPENYALIGLVLIIWGALYLFDEKLSKGIKDRILLGCKYCLLIAPLLIAMYSWLFLSDFAQTLLPINSYHSGGDMVWDVFRFDTINHKIINGLILTGSISFLYLRKNKAFATVLIIVVVTFYNPINYVFLAKYMSSVVYWRSMDIFLNYFVISLFVSAIFVLIERYKYVMYGCAFILLISIGRMSYVQYHGYYHEMFRTNADYNPIYKADKYDLNIANALMSEIYYSNIEKPLVVSHFKQIIGYVPEIITPMSFNNMRVIEQIYGNNDMPDELFRIFYPRDWAAKDIFIQKTDYTRACAVLIDRKIDYVILDKEETYINDEGIYFPLIYEVRKCADPLYENAKYILYRFYWD